MWRASICRSPRRTGSA